MEGIKYFIQGVNIFLDIFRRSILQAKINKTIVIQKYWSRFMFMHIKTQYYLGLRLGGAREIGRAREIELIRSISVPFHQTRT